MSYKSSSTVEIIFNATDNVSSTADKIKKSISQLDKQSNTGRNNDPFSRLSKNISDIGSSTSKVDRLTKSMGGLYDKIGGINSKMNDSSIFGKIHNQFDSMSQSTSDALNNMTGFASKIHPVLGAITSVGSVALKAKSIWDSTKLSIAQPVMSAFGGTIRELVSPINLVNKGFSNWRNTLVGVASSVFLIKGAVSVISNSMKSVDDFATNKARLGMANEKFQGRPNAVSDEKMYQGVYKLAEDTRMTFQDTANIVSKMGINVGDAFKDSKQLSRFVETITKSLAISGTSGTEKQSALLQLTQALSSGVLQGDELRSLSENAPHLMQVLSDGLGVQRGELKKLGSEGKLTTDKIIDAVLKGSQKVDNAFSKIPLRFSDMANLIKLKFQSAMDSAYQSLIDLINIDSVKNMISRLTPVFDGFSKTVGMVADGIGVVIGAFDKFGASSGIMAFLDTFSGVSITMAGLFKGGVLGNLMVFAGILRTLSQYSEKDIPTIVRGFKNLVTNGFEVLADGTGVFLSNLSTNFSKVFNELAKNAPEIIDSFTKNFSEIGTSLAQALPDMVDSLGNFIVTGLQSLRNNLPQIGDTILEVLSSAVKSVASNAPAIGEEVANLINEAFSYVQANDEKISALISTFGEGVTKAIQNVLKEINLGEIGEYIGRKWQELKGSIDLDLSDIINIKRFKPAMFIGGVSEWIESSISELKKNSETSLYKLNYDSLSEFSSKGFGKFTLPEPEISNPNVVSDKVQEEITKSLEVDNIKVSPEDLAPVTQEVMDNFVAGINAFEGSGDISQAIGNVISKGFESTDGGGIAETFTALASQLLGGLSTALSEVEDVTSLGTAISTALTTALSGDGMGESLVTVAQSLMSGLATAISTVEDVSSIGTAISTAISTAMSSDGASESLLTAGTTLMTSLANVLTENGELLTSAMETLMTSMATEVVSGGEEVNSSMESVMSSAVSTAESYVGQFTSVGYQMMAGVASGVSSGSGVVQSAVASVMASAVASAKASLDINSPSKIFEKLVGLPIPQGVAKGVVDNTSLAVNAVKKMASKITEPIFGNKLNTDISYSLNTEDIKEEKLKLTDEIRAEIINASRIKFIERVATVTNAPSINLNGNISEKADFREILKQLENYLAEMFQGDLRISRGGVL